MLINALDEGRLERQIVEGKLHFNGDNFFVQASYRVSGVSGPLRPAKVRQARTAFYVKFSMAMAYQTS